MKMLFAALLAATAAAASPAVIVQSVSYAVGSSGPSTGGGTFNSYTGSVSDLARVTFDLTVTYSETDNLFTYPGAPAVSGTASGIAGVVISNGVSASTSFSPVRFSCAAGAATCGAALSTPLHFDVPVTALAAFVGTGALSLSSQGSFLLSYDTRPGITGSASNARINGAVTYALLSDVPEPASWAMMIGGFGMVGGALRRRPRAVAQFA